MKWYKSLPALLILFHLVGNLGCQQDKDPLPDNWSLRMAESEVLRSPQAWMLNFSRDLSWNYCHGLVCSALLESDAYYGLNRYYPYVKQYADTMILDGGNIIGYRKEDQLLSDISTGRILFPLYRKDQNEKYRLALDLLCDQLRQQPRTSEGGFWHKKITPSQVWLDGVYMALPFYVQYAALFNEPTLFEDAILQIELIRKHLYDPLTGLYRHGWDESRQQQWADTTGRSPHVWRRAQGWLAMGMVEMLEYIPEDHPKRKFLTEVFEELMTGIVKAQDKESGVWFQVMDQPSGQGNYLESSASCMITYALLKGVRMGYLEEYPWISHATTAYKGILKAFIRPEHAGTYTITECCEVGGLGGKPYQAGDYDYYIRIPRRNNDPKAVGPFILASLEMERLPAR